MLASEYFRALTNSMEREFRIKHFQKKKKKRYHYKSVLKKISSTRFSAVQQQHLLDGIPMEQ